MAEEKEKETKEKAEDKKEFALIQIPTQLGLAIQTPEGEQVSQEELLVIIANEVREIKKVVG